MIMSEKFKLLSQKCAAVAVFRNLKRDRVVSALMSIIAVPENDLQQFLAAYSELIEALYQHGTNLSEYLLKIILEDENLYIVAKAQGKNIDDYIEEAAEYELEVFHELSLITPQELAEAFGYGGFLPKWRTSDIDFIAE